tara:strand:+ start:2251 stop:3900 length:1650 start_codon:yes stop_codon:yes gene_type:complete
MAKLGSILKNVGKATKKINPGKFLKGKKESLLKSVKGGVKGLQQSRVKGKNSLLNVKSLEPIRPDLKQGGVRKVRRLVENRVQTLVPKLAKSVTSKVNQFDPNALLGKIFDGGLNSLKSFASGLGGLKGSLQRNLEFLKEAKGIIVDLINKMAKAKPRSSGGFFKGLIKNIAKVGLLAMAIKAAPAAMGIAAVGGKMALGAGVLAAGGLLAGKAFGAVKRGLEKRKQDASKIDGDRFNEIIEKFQSELNMIERKQRRRKDEEPEDEQEETTEGTDTTTTTTESKVEPQDEAMGGKSPNALLKIEEGGKMIITPTQEGSQETKDTVDSKIEPAAVEEKPQGLKRVLAGMLDNVTGNRFDFDERGTKMDGLKRFLKGDRGEDGGKGGRGALGSQGEPGKKDMLSLAGQVIGLTPMGIMAGGIIKGGEFIANKLGGKTEKTIESAGGRTRGKGKDKDSTIEPAASGAAGKLEISKDISQPAIQSSGKGGGSAEGGILPIPLPAQDKKRRAGQSPIQRTQNATKNVVPILPAIDMSNIHIQYSRSVFNIVDAM